MPAARARHRSAMPPASAANANESPAVPHTRALPASHNSACAWCPSLIHPNPNGGSTTSRNVSSATHAAGALIAGGHERASRRIRTPASAMYVAGTSATASNVIQMT